MYCEEYSYQYGSSPRAPQALHYIVSLHDLQSTRHPQRNYLYRGCLLIPGIFPVPQRRYVNTHQLCLYRDESSSYF